MTIIIESVQALLAAFDGFLIDQWGVIHDGNAVYPGVAHALETLRRSGKKSIILTNSSKSEAVNRARLQHTFSVSQDSYSHLVSSTDVLMEFLLGGNESEGVSGAAFVVADGSDGLITERCGLAVSDTVADAEYVLLLSAAAGQDREKQMDWIGEAAGRGLPLFCPSADESSVTASGVVDGLASIVRAYEAAGGRVRNFGKPAPQVYRRCGQLLGEMDPERVLAVGDQWRTDVLGAKGHGYKALLVATGATERQFGTTDLHALRSIFLSSYEATQRPDFVMSSFRW